MTPLVVQGMLGLGDNLHERAIVRKLMLHHDAWLETPWPSVFHDLAADGLKLLAKPSKLRTQEKNAQREVALYSRMPPPNNASRMRVWYTHDEIRRHGSFLAAMAGNCGVNVGPGDFIMTIPPAWDAKADAWMDRWKPTRPLMLYRPLVDRTEWSGCVARNPDPVSYVRLAQSIRERFFVISIADLVPRTEWIVGESIKADVECHAGELDFQTIAALASRSALVFCSPGFAIILAQAVGAPLIAVFGGHEAARFYDHGDANHLFIQPIAPCECFSKSHACRKAIDMPTAERRIKEFCDAAGATDNEKTDGRNRRAESVIAAFPAALFQPAGT
jgi:hypothetical protein